MTDKAFVHLAEDQFVELDKQEGTQNHSETSDRTVRVSTLAQQGTENDLRHMTPAERIGIMWQLAIDAWAFKGEDVAESRLPRHVTHIKRGGR